MCKYIIVLFLVISCTKVSKKKEFYKTGEICSEYEIDENNSKSGLEKLYYKNGKLKRILLHNSNVLVDTSYQYYNDGTVKIKTFKTKKLDSTYYYINDCIYYKGVLQNNNSVLGWWDNLNCKESSLLVKKQFVEVGNDIVENQSIFYNNNKIIDSLSYYFKINVNDTLIKGVSYDVKIEYSKPKRDINRVYLLHNWEINNNFSNLNELEYDTINGFDNEINFKLSFDKIGDETFRSLIKIDDMKIKGKNINDSTLLNVREFTKDMFVEKYIYVKENDSN